MKKLIIPFILTYLAIIVLLSSCGSSTSITKRRYMRGYYISHSATKHTTPVKHEKTAISRVNKPSQVTPVESEKSTAKQVQTTEVSKSNPLTANNINKKSETTHKVAKTPSGVSTGKNNTPPVELSVKKEFKSIQNTVSHRPSASSDDDGLSLLWIVIVVVLVLFLLGAVSGSFFGGLLYILLVVALILLILWLLRVL